VNDAGFALVFSPYGLSESVISDFNIGGRGPTLRAGELVNDEL